MARKTGNRSLRNAVAIVGEGESEWHYFNGLRTAERLPFKVSPELPKHPDYGYVFKKAEALIAEGYNTVYCVLDVDTVCRSRGAYDKYLRKKKKTLKRGKEKIIVIESMPCIELWFLLHFTRYSTKEYRSYEQLASALKQYVPDYEKSDAFFRKRNFYAQLQTDGSPGRAATIAGKLLAAYEQEDSITFPRTGVHQLIEKLLEEG